MPVREASAVWFGDLRSGKGTMNLGSGAYSGAYTYKTRFEEEPGANPEELIGAAHAGCFSMKFAGDLAKAGHMPKKIATTGKVTLDKREGGFWISSITLICEADVPGIDKDTFVKIAGTAKETCPVSQLVKGTEVRLEVTLL